MGPIAQGPGKIAKVTARVNVQTPVVTRHVGEQITFGIRIPLEIDMVIDLRIDKPRFMVFGEIALRATALAAEPLLLILDVHKPRPSDISIHVTSKSLRAEVLRIVAGVDAEIKRFIAAHVSGRDRQPGRRQGQGHRRRRATRRDVVRHLIGLGPTPLPLAYSASDPTDGSRRCSSPSSLASVARLGPRPSPLERPRKWRHNHGINKF